MILWSKYTHFQILCSLISWKDVGKTIWLWRYVIALTNMQFHVDMRSYTWRPASWERTSVDQMKGQCSVEREYLPNLCSFTCKLQVTCSGHGRDGLSWIRTASALGGQPSILPSCCNLTPCRLWGWDFIKTEDGSLLSCHYFHLTTQTCPSHHPPQHPQAPQATDHA